MEYYKRMLERVSTRDFEQKRASVETLAQLQTHFGKCMRLQSGDHIGLFLATPDLQRLCGVAGYQGFLIRAPHYAVLLSDNGANSAERAGFIGSDLTLKMTEMGLSQCWVTIKSFEGVREAFGMPERKKVSAVIAFGYGRPQNNHIRLHIENKTKVDVIRQDEHQAPKIDINELVYEGDWGEKLYVSDITDMLDLKYAFIAASMAPSYLNLQPYRFIWDKDIIALVSLREDLTDPYDARLNVGIVMHHFAAALVEYRHEAPQWVMGAPEGRNYSLPQNGRIAAWCHA